MLELEIGLTTGVLYKSSYDIVERLNAVMDIGCEVVELGFVKINDFTEREVGKIKPEHLKDFKYVSLHAPVIHYGYNQETARVFELIKKINRIRPLDLVVFHPDTVINFGVFDDAAFNVGFENMDRRKQSHKTPEDFELIMVRDESFRFVLDVNHVFSNDPSMLLAAEFYRKFRDRISQIHLSGYKGYHDPLFKTEQVEIIRAIEDLTVPIIIESVLHTKDLQRELDYITQKIKELTE